MDGVAADGADHAQQPDRRDLPGCEVIERFAALCREQRSRPPASTRPTATSCLKAPNPTPPPDDAIRLYSFSKAYAVPGHRIGALTLPAKHAVAQAMKVLDCMTICPQRPAQHALTWAIDALRGLARGQTALKWPGEPPPSERSFAAIPAWQIDSLGAYFAYMRHPFRRRVRLDGGRDGWPGITACLLLPAPAFAGSPDHLRVSRSPTWTQAGIERLAARLATVPTSPIAGCVRALAA